MRGALLVGLGFALGCAPRPGVLRVEDGAYVLGDAYPSDAYALMLAGVLAEGDGRFAAAAGSYGRALRLAPDDSELATRMYHASCFAASAGSFGEPAARERWLEPALARGYAPAYVALEACVRRQGARGDAKQLARARAGIVQSARDPDLAARAEASELRLSVLVTAHPESREAHLALAGCLEREGKRGAAAVEYAEYARSQPSARAPMLRKAEAFAAHGDAYDARWIAGAAVDAPSLEGAPLGELPAVGARLAVDEALWRRDARAALRRASRGRVPLGEVAARAMLAGDSALAERLAHAVVGAGEGPADGDAAAVLLALGEPLPAKTSAPTEAGRQLVARLTAP